MRRGFHSLIQGGTELAMPAVEATTAPFSRVPSTRRLRAEMASTALSVRMTRAGWFRSQWSQKPPRALRDPGAMPLKRFVPGCGAVPRISAPVVCPLAFRQMKTALILSSA